jgi:hypothetical protein
LSGTAVARFAGTVKITVGAVASAVAHDVKVHTKLLASALPAVSLAEVVIVAVYATLVASPGLLGVKIAILFGASKVTVPATALVPTTVKVAVLIVKGSIALVKVAVIFLLVG